jgi:hypothetical protein
MRFRHEVLAVNKDPQDGISNVHMEILTENENSAYQIAQNFLNDKGQWDFYCFDHPESEPRPFAQ